MHPYTKKRSSETRYAAIAEHVGDRRDFTVLDIGGLDGYFSKRLTDEFGAECTVVDDSPALEGLKVARVINQRLTAADIRRLGKFDVVLCLSVLHHIPTWKSTLNAVLKAAPLVFIETANPAETLPKAVNHSASEEIAAAVEAAKAVPIAYTPGYDSRFQRPLWMIDRTED